MVMRGGVMCIFYPYLFTVYLTTLLIVQIIHRRMVGWLVSINRQNMFKNAAIPSLQFATTLSRAQKLVVAQVYNKFSALNVLL